MTQERDIVLVYHEDAPLFFARVEDISPDRKPDWYHIKLLVLQIPVHVVTWILRDIYINGAEFTMGGKRMRMERVKCPPEDALVDPREPPRGGGKEEKSTRAKVIPLADLKKK